MKTEINDINVFEYLIENYRYVDGKNITFKSVFGNDYKIFNDFDVNVLEVWVGRENNDKIAIRNCTSNVLSEYEIETSPILNKKFYNLKFRWLPLKNIKKN